MQEKRPAIITTPERDARPPHRAWFPRGTTLLWAALALAINAAALALAANSIDHWKSPAALGKQAAPVMVELVAIEPLNTAPKASPPPPQAPSKPSHAAARKQGRPASMAASAAPENPSDAASQPSSAVAASVVNSVTTAAGEPDRFFSFDEVDAPARPDSDWNLDTAVLDSIGVPKIVFEVFVSDTGQVVGCTIKEPENLAPEARALLESRLRETLLTPAERGGRPVASVRTIELYVLQPG